MNYVLDACAMIAFLRGEARADVVGRIISDRANGCTVHAVNLCEVYYDFIRASEIKTARSAIRDLARLGIRTRSDMDRPFWLRVGELKGSIRRISLADCFAIALAERIEAEIVTSDRGEFGPLAESGVCRVKFIR